MFNIKTIDLTFCKIYQRLSFANYLLIVVKIRICYHTLNIKNSILLFLYILIIHDDLIYYQICTTPETIGISIPKNSYLCKND